MALIFPYHHHLTREEFEEHSGYNIIDRLLKADETNEEVLANNFLQECTRMVYDFILQHTNINIANSIYNSDDEEVINILTMAEYYQTLYIFENGGSLQSLNGSDNYVSIGELRGCRDYSPQMINLLASNGFLYCGVM